MVRANPTLNGFGSYLQIYSLCMPVISYSDFASYFTEKVEDRVSSLLPNQQSYLIFSASLVYKYAHRQISIGFGAFSFFSHYHTLD